MEDNNHLTLLEVQKGTSEPTEAKDTPAGEETPEEADVSVEAKAPPETDASVEGDVSVEADAPPETGAPLEQETQEKQAKPGPIAEEAEQLDLENPEPESIGAKPRFDPPLRFGSEVKRYKGKLYLSKTLAFSVQIRRQKEGSFYALSGTVSMLDPATGHLMQLVGDQRKALDDRRREKGLEPIGGKHNYASAVKKEINIKRQENENYTKIIKAEAIRIALLLAKQHQDAITERMSTNSSLDRLPLSLIYDGFVNPYLDSRTKSADMKALYGRQIRQAAEAVGDKPLGDWSLSMLSRLAENNPKINRDSMDEVLRFLDYVSSHRHVANPVAVCLQEYLAQNPKEKRNPQKKQRDAVNAVILPSRAEEALDKAAWANMGDPDYLAYMMVKESGLDVAILCSLTIKDIQFGLEAEKVFITLQKNYTKSATHDYTFPLLPSGAVYLRQYITALRSKYGEDRVQGERFLISADKEGKERYDEGKTKEVKDFLNRIISGQKIGYAALVALKDHVVSSKGEYLLLETYRHRIDEIFCGQGNMTCDDGAVTFLSHRALNKSVQSDHYRAFADESGKSYLFDSLMKDARDPMRYLPTEVEHHFRRKSMKRVDNKKLITYPAKAGKHGQVLEITLDGLRPGDIITVASDHGLLVSRA